MRTRSTLASWIGLGAAVAIAACSAADHSASTLADDDTTAAAGGQGGTGGALDAAGSTASGFNPTVGGSSGIICDSGPNDDQDKDGFTPAEGDCNDCDGNMNPGAIEVPTADGETPADENCNDIDDEPPTECESQLAIDDNDAMSGARAINLCQKTSPAAKTYGVLSAQYVRADGSATKPGLSVGILDGFGANVAPRAGARVLSLSSGHARAEGQPGACGQLSCYTSGPGVAPPGFPQDVPGCSGATDINDDIALQLRLRAPTNAKGYSYDFNFYSFEYPEWVCTSFNDQFIALVDPAPMGAINGNISFDSQNNPVSVNIAFFDVCAGCALGIAELQGTGFDTWDDAGATSWLTTTAPIKGGEEFSIRFAIWDTGDQAWDSTVLIDNFQWVADAGTVSVGTIKTPK
jgi:hypothetical protein